MTKEELEKEAEEWIKDHSGLIGGYKFVKYDYDSMQKAYLAGAEPREKRIEELEAENDDIYDALNTQSLRMSELEAQIEKMKSHSSCKHRNEYNEFDPYSRVCQGCCNLEKWEFGN